MRRFLGMAAAFALVAQFTLAPAAFAAAPGPEGYAGTWRTVECATWWAGGEGYRCDEWGDGSTLTLKIGTGDHPRLVHTDSYSSYCADDLESPSTHWRSLGVGTYDEDGLLWADFYIGGCGTADLSFHSMGALYRDPGSDTLWNDPDGDGWGLTWFRVGG